MIGLLAHAAQPQLEGAALAEAADGILAHWRHPAEGATLVARGRVGAEPVQGGWRLALPPIEWTRPGGERLRIAGAYLTLQPLDAERIQAILRLPQTIPVFDRAGLSLGQITVGRQRIEAIWERRLDALTRLQIRIEQLRGRDRRGRESFHLGTVNLAGRFDEGAGGAWTGAWSLDLSDFAADGVRLPALNLSGKGRAMRLLDYAAAAAAAGIDWRLGPQQPERARLARQLPQLLGPLDHELSANELEIGRAGMQPLYRLERAEATLSLKPAGPERIAAHLLYQHSGLESAAVPADLVPSRLDLDLDLSNALAGALEALVLSGPSAALEALGGRLAVKRAEAESPSLTLTATGAIAAPTGQPRPYSGRIDASLAGVSELMERDRKRPPGRLRMPQPFLMMAIIGFGQPRVGPDRRTVYDYKIELAPDGRLTVNGHDLTQLRALLQVR